MIFGTIWLQKIFQEIPQILDLNQNLRNLETKTPQEKGNFHRKFIKKTIKNVAALNVSVTMNNVQSTFDSIGPLVTNKLQSMFFQSL